MKAAPENGSVKPENESRRRCVRHISDEQRRARKAYDDAQEASYTVHDLRAAISTDSSVSKAIGDNGNQCRHDPCGNSTSRCAAANPSSMPARSSGMQYTGLARSKRQLSASAPASTGSKPN